MWSRVAVPASMDTRHAAQSQAIVSSPSALARLRPWRSTGSLYRGFPAHGGMQLRTGWPAHGAGHGQTGVDPDRRSYFGDSVTVSGGCPAGSPGPPASQVTRASNGDGRRRCIGRRPLTKRAALLDIGQGDTLDAVHRNQRPARWADSRVAADVALAAPTSVPLRTPERSLPRIPAHCS